MVRWFTTGVVADMTIHIPRPLVLILGLFSLALVLVGVAGFTQTPTVKAQPEVIPGETITCDPIDVGVFPERIHVRCAEEFKDVEYFAVSTRDALLADRYLNVLLTALTEDKQLQIHADFNEPYAGESFGCYDDNCRPILFLTIIK